MKYYNKDVVAKIASELNCDIQTVKKITDSYINEVTNVLCSGDTFYVKNLGRLTPNRRKGFVYTNRKGEQISIPDTTCVYFKSSRKLKEAINQ